MMLRKLSTYKAPNAIELINAAVKNQEAVNTIFPHSYRRPIDYAALAGNLDVINHLLSLGATLACDANYRSTTNLLYWIINCPDLDKRRKMLYWLLEDENYKKLNCNITETHIGAALGEIDYNFLYLIENPIADKSGLLPLHCYVGSGIELNPPPYLEMLYRTIDLNYGSPDFPLASLLALQGKFDFLEQIYTANLTLAESLGIQLQVNFNDILDDKLIVCESGVVYPNTLPPLCFYLADMGQWSLLEKYINHFKDESKIDLSCEYKTINGYSLQFHAIKDNKWDLLNKLLDSSKEGGLIKSITPQLDSPDGSSYTKGVWIRDSNGSKSLTPISERSNENDSPESLDLELATAMMVQDYNKVDIAIKKGANPNRVVTKLGKTAIGIAGFMQITQVLSYLIATYDIDLFDVNNPDRTNFLLHVCSCPHLETRKMILLWMLEEPQFSKLKCGITKEHILAAMGEYFGESLPDASGLKSSDYMIISGLSYPINKEARKAAIKQISTNKFSRGGWLHHASHFGLLSYLEQYEIIDKALDFGIKLDLSEKIIDVSQKNSNIYIAVKMIDSGKITTLTEWMKKNKELSIDLFELIDDECVTQRKKPVNILSYLMDKEYWEFLEFLLLREMKKNDNNDQWNKCQFKLFSIPGCANLSGWNLSLARVLIERDKIDLLEKIWRIKPDILQLFMEERVYLCKMSNALRLTGTKRGCQFLVNILRTMPALMSIINLTEKNEANVSMVWQLAYHKEFTLLSKLLDCQCKISHDNQEKIDLKEQQDNLSLFALLEGKPHLLKLVAEYNDVKSKKISNVQPKSAQSQQLTTQSTINESQISPKEIENLKKEQGYVADVEELKIAFGKIFADRVSYEIIARDGAKISIIFSGSKKDILGFYSVISQYVKNSEDDAKNNAKNNNKMKVLSFQDKGEKPCVNMHEIKLSILKQNFIHDANVVRQLKNFALDKKEEHKDTYFDFKTSKPLTEKDQALWLQFIETSFCRHNEEASAVWDGKQNCLVIHFKDIDIWQIWDLKDKTTKLKPSKHQKQLYELPAGFVENCVAPLMQKVIKNEVAAVVFDQTDNTIKIYPHDVAPATSHLHDTIYREIKKQGKPIDARPSKETAAEENPETDTKNNNNTIVTSDIPEEDANEEDILGLEDSQVLQNLEAELQAIGNVGNFPAPATIHTESLAELSDLEKIKWLLAAITNDGQAFNFLTKKHFDNTKKWKISFHFKGTKTIAKKNSLQYFDEIKEAVNLIFPQFMKVFPDKQPILIVLDILKYPFDMILSKLNEVAMTYQGMMLISEWERMQQALNNNSENATESEIENKTDNLSNHKGGPSVSIDKPIVATTTTKPKETTEAALTEREIYAALTRFSTDRNLVYHLKQLLVLTQAYKDESKDKNHVYYLYLIHLQTVMVLMDKHESRISKDIFKNLRNIIRHAYLDANFEPSTLYTLMHPLLLAINEVNNFKQFPATSLRLFSPRLRSDLQKVMAIIRDYKKDLQDRTLGNDMDKAGEVLILKEKITAIRHSLTIHPAVKRKTIVMLCSLIGETEKVEPYVTIYRMLGHDDNLEGRHFGNHINSLYYKNLFLINALHPIIPTSTSATTPNFRP